MADKRNRKDCRVLHVISHMSEGGAQRCAWSLHTKLSELGFQSYYLDLGTGRLTGGRVVTEQCMGLKVVAVMAQLWAKFIVKFFPNRPDTMLFFHSNMVSWVVGKFKINVMHSNLFHADSACSVCAYERGVHFISTDHGDFKFIRGKNLASQESLVRISNSLDKIIVFSYSNRLEILKTLDIADSKFFSLPYCIYQAPLYSRVDARQMLGVTVDQIAIIMVGRGIREKGWVQAAAAFSLCISENENLKTKAVLLLAGNLSALEADILTAGKGASIKFLGFRTDIAQLLVGADFMSMPSYFSGETQPVILIEAMSAGLPIVATDFAGIPDLVRDSLGSAGILVEGGYGKPASVRELANAFRRMLTEPFILSEYSIQARRLAARFEPGRVAQAHADLYCSVINKSPGGLFS